MKGILYFCKITFPSFFTTLIGNAPWTITLKYPSFIIWDMVYRQILNIVSKLVMIQSVMLNVECSYVFWHRFPLIFATTLSVTPPLLCTSLHNTSTLNIWPPLSLPLQVTVARFSSRVPFTSQLTMAHNTDILVGWWRVTYHRVTYHHSRWGCTGRASPTSSSSPTGRRCWSSTTVTTSTATATSPGEPQPTGRKPAWGSSHITAAFTSIPLLHNAHETNLYWDGSNTIQIYIMPSSSTLHPTNYKYEVWSWLPSAGCAVLATPLLTGRGARCWPATPCPGDTRD